MQQGVAMLPATYVAKYARVVCSCCLYLPCVLWPVKNSAQSRAGSTTIISPNPAPRSLHQRITLGALVAQVRTALYSSSLADRGISVTGRVLQPKILFWEANKAQEVVHLTRVAPRLGETDADEDRHGSSD